MSPRLRQFGRLLMGGRVEDFRRIVDLFRLFFYRVRMPFIRQQTSHMGPLWIDPFSLKHRTTSRFMVHLLQHLRKKKLKQHAPYIVGGKWDKALMRLEDMDSHYAFFQKYAGILDFRKTDYYQRVSRIYESGGRKNESRTIDDWERRVAKTYDAIFESIKKNGFKTQEELSGPYGIAEEIAVCVDRNGEFLFLNGKHRLAMAMALKLEKIPVALVAVHRIWHYVKEDDQVENVKC